MSEETTNLPQNSHATETLNSEIQRRREAAKAALKEMVLLDREAMLLSEEAERAREAVRAGGLDVGWNLQQMSRKSQMAREASGKAERARKKLERAREDLERVSRRARARTRPVDLRQISMLEVIEGGARPREEEKPNERGNRERL